MLLWHNDLEISFCVRRAIGSSGKHYRYFPVPFRHALMLHSTSIHSASLQDGNYFPLHISAAEDLVITWKSELHPVDFPLKLLLHRRDQLVTDASAMSDSLLCCLIALSTFCQSETLILERIEGVVLIFVLSTFFLHIVCSFPWCLVCLGCF